MSTWFSDIFTGPHLSLLTAHTSDSGASWVQLLGNSPQIFTNVASKSMIGPGTPASYAVLRPSVVAPAANAKILFNLHHAGGTLSFTGVGLRMSGTGAGTRGYVGVYNPATTKLEIWKLSATGTLSGSPLASSTNLALTSGTAYPGEFSVNEDLLTLTMGGLTATANDTSITDAGYAAVLFNANQGNGLFFDSFSAQDIGASAATAVTLSGPSSGNVGEASTAFTVGLNGSHTGTVVATPASDGGGTFSPPTVNIVNGVAATFTHTPSSNGVKSISVTNDSGLANPAPIAYTANAVGAPTAGLAAFVSSTSTTINLTCAAGSGGTAPLSPQWHRSTTSGFTPGAGNALAGATTLTLADSTSLTADTAYYYVCRVTDANALTGDSKQIGGVLKSATLKIGVIGDSIYAGTGLSAGQDAATQCGLVLRKLYKNRDVVMVNSAVPGSRSAQWQTGQANLTAAKAAFAAAGGVDLVLCMLGANDAAVGQLVSAATYKTNLQNILADLNGTGYPVMLSYPTYIPAGANSNATTAASVALAQSYQAQIDSLIDGANVLRGDVLSFRYFMSNLGEYQSDMTHPTAAGAVALGTMLARAIDRNFLGPDRPIATKTVTIAFESRAGAQRANLSGLQWTWSDTFGTVIDSGVGATTDASSVFSVTVHTNLPAAGIGHLKVSNTNGTVNAMDIAFAGPVAVA